MIHIEITRTGGRKRIEKEVWVRRQRNGVVVTCPRPRAQGVGDGETVWSLGSLEGYPEAKLITLAEYEQTLASPDPGVCGREEVS